jgi:hypothetical protein
MAIRALVTNGTLSTGTWRRAEAGTWGGLRHTTDFTPPSLIAPPDVDAYTLALWLLDEGTGTNLDNAEGTAGRDGTLVNGAWATNPKSILLNIA